MTGYSSARKAKAFAALHVKGAPVVLYNCWDAGFAAAIAASGAPALATGSWAVAAAQGFDDGEVLPMAQLLSLVNRIAAANTIPVSVDFEGAYGEMPVQVGDNAKALMQTGVIGMNFEDRRVHAAGLFSTEDQCARISAIRVAVGADFFINARTDVFIQADATDHAGLIGEVVARGRAYAAAGASGFFVPMLNDIALIKQVCAQVPLPVNVMMHDALPDRAALQSAGVARISYGPSSYLAAMQAVGEAALLANKAAV